MTPSYRLNGVVVDRKVFYRHACDPDQSAVVEACAGAGKTWILVSRILRALLVGAQPHEILAITFTRKAAGEMQQRLNEWLREFSDPAVDRGRLLDELVERGIAPEFAPQLAPNLADLHERILGAARTVQAQTFHAWFAQLLRAAPAELLDRIGLQRDMELIETLDDHWAEVWRRFHAVVLGVAPLLDDFNAVSARRGRSSLRSWLEAALERRVEFELAQCAGVLERSVPGAIEVWPELMPFGHPALVLDGPTWRARLRELAVELGRGGNRAQGAAEALLVALESARGANLFNAVWVELFTQVGTPRRTIGASANLHAAQGDLERIAEQCRQQDAHDDHQRMVRLAGVLLVEYRSYKRSRGLADMADLETCALALLRDSTLSGWVQERLDARYRHILIDEFQDTSPLQWHALQAWLSSYAGAGGGASGQRAPSVFIVGDPKQSIYRFRRAEPRVFDAAGRFVQEALGGVMLQCDHTRRNRPQILAPINAVFSKAAAQGEFGAFRAHSTELNGESPAGVWALPVVPVYPRNDLGGGESAEVWRDSLSRPRHEPEEERRAEEARWVARAIRELVADEGLRPADIMVLCRKRQSLRLAAEALRLLRVPFLALEEHDLLEAPEVRDLLALLDVLASPGHNLSLAHALRSPMFGASDDDLIELAIQAGAGGDWWSALLDTPQPSPILQRASDLLRRWEQEARELPPHDLLDRIVHTGQFRERVASVVPPEQTAAALDAIDALLEQSLTLDGARYSTPYNFVRALKRRTIRVAPRSHADAVQLLTIHGAKGLESKVVFIMDTDPQPTPARTASVLVDWPVESPAPVRFAFLYSEARCPPSLRGPLEAEVSARKREELNGLYVAMTRAKERLVISATAPSHRSGRPSWWDLLTPHVTPWSPATRSARCVGWAREPIRLKVLPEWRAADAAGFAETPRPAPIPSSLSSVDATARRLGQAVHRLLEWVGDRPQTERLEAWPAICRQAARDFQVAPEEVSRIAMAILDSPECARFFVGSSLTWAGNEVPVSDGGEVLRIDRLVQLSEAGALVWWVLDYKLSHAPDQLQAYRDQLLRYRGAVARVEGPAAVRCAFISGTGRLIEIS
jgi:ATP-dependent helicase/nuclease subunit A